MRTIQSVWVGVKVASIHRWRTSLTNCCRYAASDVDTC